MLGLELSIALRYVMVGRGDRYVSIASAAAAIGIALGVAAVIVVLSVMNGFHLELRKKILAASSHVEIRSTSSNDLADWASIVEVLQADPLVTGAAPLIDRQGLVSNGDQVAGVSVNGVDPQLNSSVSEIDASLLSQLTSGSYKVLLGDALAEQLGVTVGDKLVMLAPSGLSSLAGVIPRLKRIEIAGIFDLGIYQYDSVLAVMHMDDVGILFNVRGVDGIRLKLTEVFAAPDFADRLRKTKQLHVYDWTTSNATLFNALAVERRVMFIILSLIILVAAFQLVSVLVTMVRSKRGDIAILRTIGASPGSILRVFLFQGLIVGIAGIIVGLVLGLSLALNVTEVVAFVENLFGTDLFPGKLYYLEQIPSEIVMSEVVAIVIVAFSMSLIATIWPTLAAAKVDPAEALRHE